MTINELKSVIGENYAAVEKKLSEKLDLIKIDTAYPVFSSLEKSMRYSLEAGGKRIRPCLVIEFSKLFGGSLESAIDYACSIEMIHTFSLIHDDMPCMDNDDMRRGKPSNHVLFGEATALLAGDSLLAYAFETLDSPILSDAQNLSAHKVLAHFTGPCGMCAGQQIDLESENKIITFDTLKILHSKKTGALIKCSCILGCIAAGKSIGSDEYLAACKYSENIGLAFQIADDILDVVGDEKKLGKKCGSDQKDGKNTSVSLLGIDKAKSFAQELTDKAKKSISKYDGSGFLCALADYIITRDN